jgi:hypothetical protein
MGLNVKIYNIVSDGSFSIRYKSGESPYPETIDSSFTLLNTGLTVNNITISGLSFDTQYWIKMTDETTGRYIIKNIYTHDSKAFPCYDTMCFDVQTVCVSPSPTPSVTPSVTPSATPPPPSPSVTPTITPSVTSTTTPTPTPTPTRTLTPTPTPSCQYLSWTIQECTGGTCPGGVCGCSGSVTTTVYTQCNVGEFTGVSTAIYTNTALTNPFTGNFMHSSSPNDIFNSTGSGVSYVCTVGGPC